MELGDLRYIFACFPHVSPLVFYIVCAVVLLQSWALNHASLAGQRGRVFFRNFSCGHLVQFPKSRLRRLFQSNLNSATDCVQRFASEDFIPALRVPHGHHLFNNLPEFLGPFPSPLIVSLNGKCVLKRIHKPLQEGNYQRWLLDRGEPETEGAKARRKFGGS